MGIKIICQNRKASYNFFLEKKYEAGIKLGGCEIKSIRQGKCHITNAFVTVEKDERSVSIHNMFIAHYEFGNINNHDETRVRRLLLHKREIKEIKDAIKLHKLTVVATKVYLKHSLAKVEIATAKGKKLYDKRQDKTERAIERKLSQREYNN